MFLARNTGIVALAAACSLLAQPGTENGEWRYYGGDTRNTKYSPQTQITAENVKSLTVAWRWSSRNAGPAPEFTSEVTPLMVGGKLYFTKTGAEIARVELPARATAVPMTYTLDGRQFIVLSIGGPNFPAEFVALALPQPRATPAAKPAPQE